jgi:hypothetical protein
LNSRNRVGTEADPLVGVPVEERGDAAKLRGRVIELEAKASSLEADRVRDVGHLGFMV